MITFKQYLQEITMPKQYYELINQFKNYTDSSFPKRPPRMYEAKYWIKQHFENAGFNHMGMGNWAVVAGHDKYQYVVKVFSQHDEGFIRWLKFVQKNQDNPWVPKIKGLPTKIPQTDLMAIRLEPLIKPSLSEHNKVEAKCRAYMIDDIETFDQELEDCLDHIIKYIRSHKKPVENHLDFAHGNILKRKNGHFVLTDPIWPIGK